jgi:hypothetical protein
VWRLRSGPGEIKGSTYNTFEEVKPRASAHGWRSPRRNFEARRNQRDWTAWKCQIMTLT